MEALTTHRWPTDEFPRASLGVRLGELARRCAFPTVAWEEDGLGAAEGIALRTQSGLVFLLRELRHAVEHLGSSGPDVLVDAEDVSTRGIKSIIDEILAALSLSRSDLTWIQDSSAQKEAADVTRCAREYRSRHSSAEPS